MRPRKRDQLILGTDAGFLSLKNIQKQVIYDYTDPFDSVKNELLKLKKHQKIIYRDKNEGLPVYLYQPKKGSTQLQKSYYAFYNVKDAYPVNKPISKYDDNIRETINKLNEKIKENKQSSVFDDFQDVLYLTQRTQKFMPK